MGWEDFLCKVQSDGRFGDEIAVRTMQQIFRVDFRVISTLGLAAKQIITAHSAVAMTRLNLGHFLKNEATNYVALNSNRKYCEGKYIHHSFTHSVNFFKATRKSTKAKEPIVCPIMQLLFNQ